MKITTKHLAEKRLRSCKVQLPQHAQLPRNFHAVTNIILAYCAQSLTNSTTLSEASIFVKTEKQN